jgi:hypothetical protein
MQGTGVLQAASPRRTCKHVQLVRQRHLSSSGLSQAPRLVPARALDGGIQLQVLPDSDVRPQDVELGAHAQVAPDGWHVAEDGAAVDPCSA